MRTIINVALSRHRPAVGVPLAAICRAYLAGPQHRPGRVHLPERNKMSSSASPASVLRTRETRGGTS